jgi:hypothetical protein
MAVIYRSRGDLIEAIEQLRMVVELYREIGHPDLQSDTELLAQVEKDLAEGQGNPES